MVSVYASLPQFTGMAAVSAEAGADENSLNCSRMAFRLFERSSDRPGQAGALIAVGHAHERLGDLDAAALAMARCVRRYGDQTEASEDARSWLRRHAGRSSGKAWKQHRNERAAAALGGVGRSPVAGSGRANSSSSTTTTPSPISAESSATSPSEQTMGAQRLRPATTKPPLPLGNTNTEEGGGGGLFSRVAGVFSVHSVSRAQAEAARQA